MDYNITYREKDKGIQFIISYKDHNGKWKQKSKQGFKKKSEAKRAADDMLEDLKENHKIKLSNEYQGLTLKGFIEIYIRDLQIRREYNTTTTSKAAFKKIEKIYDMPIDKIEYAHIQDCVNGMIKEGLKVSTIKEYVTKISTLFNNAIEPYKIIISNPVKGVRYPIIDDHGIDDKIKALTKQELDYVLNHPKIYNKKRDYMAMSIASSCGLRLGEIVGLTWSNIDFKNNLIIVDKQWKKDKEGNHGFGKLKTKNSYRSVPMPKKLSTELIKYQLNMPTDRFNRIFIDSQSVNMSVRIRKRFQSLGMENSLHDLRHTYVTLLIPKLDFKTISELIGDTVEIVMKVYSHVNEDMLENATTAINQTFN